MTKSDLIGLNLPKTAKINILLNAFRRGHPKSQCGNRAVSRGCQTRTPDVGISAELLARGEPSGVPAKRGKNFAPERNRRGPEIAGLSLEQR